VEATGVTFSRPDPSSVEWRGGHETLRIEAWGPDGLRVRAALGAPISDPLAGVGAIVDPVPASGPADVSIGPAGARIANGAIAAEVTADGAVRFVRTSDGAELLAEQERHFAGAPARAYDEGGSGLQRIEVNFAAADGERFHGLGQQQHGRLDLKGSVIDLVQVNSHVVIPFVVSSRGYGFLWHSPATGRVELAANATRWVADAAPQVDYWVTAAASPAGILERYTAVTGRAPAFPSWAAGFWQSKLRYRSQDELLAVAREHHRRGLPLSVIVADGGHWSLMGEWRFDEALWPDPGAMVAELRDMGVELAVSVWPTINALGESYATLRDNGWLVRTARGSQMPTPLFDNRPEGAVQLHLLDATDPHARAFQWARLREGYRRHGIRLFWLDADEPEVKPLQPDNLRYRLGHGSAVHDIYPMLASRTIFEGLRADGEADVLTLNRSAWAGSQRYGAAVWSGDVDATFAALRAQVPAALNIGMSGIPWWGSDIGGFKGGDPADPAFRELIVRWAQFGVFCPIFRFHGVRAVPGADLGFRDLADLGEAPSGTGDAMGPETPGGDVPGREIAGRDSSGGAAPPPFSLATLTGGPNEVWSFGDEVYAIVRDLLFLRERLRPYLMEQMATASATGLPPMRALFLEFPDDPGSADLADAFLLGPDVLVAPVLQAGAREREVYLPAGATWRDAWTDEPRPAGEVHVAAAPLDRVPVYLRDGARVPIRAE
jgi:alpha-D-xyloside xylohydrolase